MKNNKRRLVAIGDLHGDFYRLARILSEQSIVLPETLQWRADARHFDLVLLGDYVDWRGEPLEGPYSEWPYGARKILELVHNLYLQVQELSKQKTFKSRFYPLLGNHDEMMLEGLATMKKLSGEENQQLHNFHDAEGWVQHFLRLNLTLEQEQNFTRFINWYEQGGEKTIESFGGLQQWLAAMEGYLGSFLRSLSLAVVVNQRLFCHSIPDDKSCWVRIDGPTASHDENYEKIREQFLWGRKVWGYDAFMGIPTRPLTENEVDEMLEKLGVKSVVVGHTPLRKDRPYLHFGGKVVNLDTHGIPGSQPLVEEYSIEEIKKSRKAVRLKKKLRVWKRLGRN